MCKAVYKDTLLFFNDLERYVIIKPAKYDPDMVIMCWLYFECLGTLSLKIISFYLLILILIIEILYLPMLIWQMVPAYPDAQLHVKNVLKD